MNLIRIVHQLRLASGTNAKLEILKQYSNNEMWKKFLVATYDERISYGVSAPKVFDYDVVEIDDAMFNCLNKLACRDITGNHAKTAVRRLSQTYGEIPRLVLDHSIKAGVSFTTINKAYPGLIEVFKSMKGKDVPIVEYPVRSSIKFDGVKVFAVVRPDSIKLLTSSGAEFELSSLKYELQKAAYGVYEGELTYKEGKQIHRSVITGLLNSLLAGTKTDISDYFFRVYDFLTLEEWDSQTCSVPFARRQERLLSSFEVNIQDSWYIKQVEHLTHNNLDEVVKYFESLIAEGYEGSMHRYDEDCYIWDRVDRLIKKKSIKECVLPCIGTIPHSNPEKGIIGSLICKGMILDKDVGYIEVEVNVGSGLSKSDIQFSPERYVGEEIEILYNTVTSTDSGYSLFLPRFKRIKGKL